MNQGLLFKEANWSIKKTIVQSFAKLITVVFCYRLSKVELYLGYSPFTDTPATDLYFSFMTFHDRSAIS